MAVFLEGAKLSAHLEVLSGGGYKEEGDLAEAEDSDLLELGLKKSELKRLRSYLAKVTPES